MDAEVAADLKEMEAERAPPDGSTVEPPATKQEEADVEDVDDMDMKRRRSLPGRFCASVAYFQGQ